MNILDYSWALTPNQTFLKKEYILFSGSLREERNLFQTGEDPPNLLLSEGKATK